MIMNFFVTRREKFLSVSCADTDAGNFSDKLNFILLKYFWGGHAVFITGFNKAQQEKFLNLAYTMVYADGRLDEREQQLFAGYSVEVDPSIDMAQVHAVDFAAELSAFDECTAVDKQKIFFELYAIALIDEAFPDSEKVLVEQAQKRFNISDDKVAQMGAALKNFIDAYKNLRVVVTE